MAPPDAPPAALCRDCEARSAGAPRRCPECGSPRVLAHAELETLSLAHLDCDAFYASVEKRDRPELRDRPVIVGGGQRGVVATACYMARQYGVRSAMPMFKALKACPDAVVVKPDFAKYKRESERILGALRALTPLVQALSLDEAWADLSGTERLNGGPAVLQLVRLQARVEAETGLTVSIGLAPNRFLAKLASELDKPRGFALIGRAEAVARLAPMPVSRLPGVGPVFARSLGAAGFRTVGELTAADPRDLVRRWGDWGLRLHHLAHARDDRPVDPGGDRRGMSTETTFNDDLSGLAELEDRLWPLCEALATKARREGVMSRTIVLKLRTADFRLLTRRRTLAEPVQTARALFRHGRDMLKGEVDGRRFRLIGIGMADVAEATDLPAGLFPTEEDRALKTERAVDQLRGRFGQAAVVTGRGLKGG